MPTLEELEELHSEDYSDQDGSDFEYLVYIPAFGSAVVMKVEENLAHQAHEIYRRFGNKTTIKLYRQEG